MDPLSALRDFTVRGELDRIAQVGEEFRFGGDYAFPCSAETAYRSKQGSLYTLDTLLYFVRHHQLKHTEYLQSARLRRIPAVTLPDRKPLLDYLTGKVTSSDAIEFVPAPAHADVEEYRPDDPGLSLPAADPSFLPHFTDDTSAAGAGGVRVPDLNVDYIAMIRALERPLKDRESLLVCRNRDFHSVLEASIKREEERQRLESQQRKDGLVAKTRLIGSEDHQRGLGGFGGAGDDAGGYDATPKPKMHLKGSKIGDGVPIILVPSAFQTLIIIYNVNEFLEDGIFVPTDVKAKMMRAASKPNCVTVQKKLSRDRLAAAYEVRDKTSAFTQKEWDRVAAVFVLGKEWQFKNWPFKDHVEIFIKMTGGKI